MNDRIIRLKKGMLNARLVFLFLYTGFVSAAPLIINHASTDITKVPESAILQARNRLHIAYGHTSHGSQITEGMDGLIGFANGGGRGLSLPDDIFVWNDGGYDGALDLHDYAMDGDVGYYPEWVNETRSYLNNPAHADVNVIMWSWCGQVDDKYAAGTLESEYLTPMSQLENDYPGVTFVYMTGHVDHWDDANNKAANQVIRDFCTGHDKVLYDFADIESYDPDGTWFEFPNDNCDYYASEDGPKLGNWAREWQDSHTENTDWYECGSQHSEPLNANQKAYAAWWMFARLAGWETTDVTQHTGLPGECSLLANFPNPFNGNTTISYMLEEASPVTLSVCNILGERQDILFRGMQPAGSHTFQWHARNLSSGTYLIRLETDSRTENRRVLYIK